jgi:hypothetical protein
MKTQKVLMILDDYEEKEIEQEIIETINEGNANVKFDTTIIRRFKSIETLNNLSFDIFLIDYGLMDDVFSDLSEDKKIEYLQEWYSEGKTIIWCSALARRIIPNVEDDFPHNKFLHNLRYVGIDPHHIRNLLCFIVEKED